MSRRKQKKSKRGSKEVARSLNEPGEQDPPTTPDQGEVVAAELMPPDDTPPGVIVQRTQSWSGPLPPPGILAEYEALVPGSAKDIISWVGDESKHRRGLESQALSEFTAADKRGTRFGFTLALLFGGGAFYLMATGAGLAGFGVFFVELTALVSVFLLGRGNRGGPPGTDSQARGAIPPPDDS